MLNVVKKMIKNDQVILCLGTGLYQITLGLFILIINSFLMGFSLIVLYPYITVLSLNMIEVIGWILISFGGYTIIYPFFREKARNNRIYVKILNIAFKISCGLTFLLVPLGIFLGLGLISVIRSYNSHPNQAEKIKRKGMVSTAFVLTAGIFNIIIGFLIIQYINPFLVDELDFLFPYITYSLINLIGLYGWLCCILGLILGFCSIWVRRLNIREKSEKKSRFLRIINILMVVTSTGLMILYPFGTYFGLAIILSFFPLKKIKKIKK